MSIHPIRPVKVVKATQDHLSLQGFTVLEDSLRLRALLAAVKRDFPTDIPVDLQEEVFQAFDKDGTNPISRGNQRMMSMSSDLSAALSTGSTIKLSRRGRAMVRWAGTSILHLVMNSHNLWEFHIL